MILSHDIKSQILFPTVSSVQMFISLRSSGENSSNLTITRLRRKIVNEDVERKSRINSYIHTHIAVNEKKIINDSIALD